MRKLLVIAVGFATGIALAVYSGLPVWQLTVFFAVITSIAVVARLTTRDIKQPQFVLRLYLLPLFSERFDVNRFTTQYFLRYASTLLVALTLGVCYLGIYSQIFYKPTTELIGHIQEVTLRALDYPRSYEFGMAVETELVGTANGARVNLWSDKREDIKPGDLLTCKVLFSYPETLPEFDFYSYYRANRVFLQGELAGSIEYESSGFSVRFIPANLRNAIRNAIESLYDSKTSGVIQALSIGDRRGISDSFRFSASASGLTHILSVSGAHITILSGMLLAAFRNKRRGAWLVAGLVVLNVLVSGASAPAMRACVMHLLAFAALMLRRDADAKTSLATALLFLLFVNPYSITDVGLQLSFCASMGLILYSRKLQSYLYEHMKTKSKWLNKLVRFFILTLSTTVIAMLFTTPLSVYHFGTISAVAVLSNLLALWILPITIAGGLISALLFYVTPTLAGITVSIISPTAQFLNAVSYYCARLPVSLIDMRSMYNVFWLLSVYVTLAIWRLFRVDKTERVALACIAAGFIAALSFGEIERRSHEMDAVVIDVGQGQSIVASSGGETLMIDCGGNSWLGAGLDAAEQLYKSGIRTLDLLVLTHYHDDHTNGLEDLLRFVKVKRAALPYLDEADGGDIERLLITHNVAIFYVNQNTDIQFVDASATLYRPVQRSGENEQGVSVLLSASEFELLVTGDLDSTSEYILVERETLDNVEAIVAGHHGSKYSTTDMFLNETRPQNAFISVGKNNYGHPTSETLERLTAHGSRVRRTDRNGTIRVVVG